MDSYVTYRYIPILSISHINLQCFFEIVYAMQFALYLAPLSLELELLCSIVYISLFLLL